LENSVLTEFHTLHAGEEETLLIQFQSNHAVSPCMEHLEAQLNISDHLQDKVICVTLS